MAACGVHILSRHFLQLKEVDEFFEAGSLNVLDGSGGDICSNLVRVYAQDSLDDRRIHDNIYFQVFFMG